MTVQLLLKLQMVTITRCNCLVRYCIVYERVWAFFQFTGQKKGSSGSESNSLHCDSDTDFTSSIWLLSRAPEMTWYQPVPQTAGESALQLRKTMVSSQLRILHNTYGIWPLPVYTSSVTFTTETLGSSAPRLHSNCFLLHSLIHWQHSVCKQQLSARHLPLRVCCTLLFIFSWDLSSHTSANLPEACRSLMMDKDSAALTMVKGS